MKQSRFTRTFVAVALIIGVASADDLYAAKSKAVSKWTYDQLQAVEKLTEAGRFSEAQSGLKKAVDRVSDNFEKAVILRALAAVYWQQENYSAAANQLVAALKLNELNEDEQRDGWLQLGQLYAALEQWQASLDALQTWMKLGGKPNAQQNIMLANGYSQLKKYSTALPYVKRAIKQSKQPEESWYRFQLGLHYELRQLSDAANVLQTLIRFYPSNKQYWEQLAGIYYEQKNYTKAAATGELAYKKGILVEEDKILGLVSLLQYLNAPYRAGTLLEREFEAGRVSAGQKNLKLLANIWLYAREYGRAAAAMQKAADLTGDIDLYMRLAQIQIADEDWAGAKRNLQAALTKGAGEQEGKAYLLLGMTNVELDELDAAQTAFKQAKRFPDARNEAEQWIAYVEAESINLAAQ